MSIPILYESGTTDFWNMGLGPLSDTLEATVTEQRNGEFYLDLSYPIDGARANELKNNRIIVADAGHSLKAQQFDITDVQRGLTKLTVHAEHVSYRTSRYPLTPTFKYTGDADSAIRAWQKAIVVDNSITADSDISTTGTVNLTIDKAQNARQVLGGVEGSILDVYGGEYRFDNEHISLLNHRGSVVNTLLAYGRNITDFNQEEAIGETYTSIYPYALVTKPGEDEATLITLPEYYVDGDYVKNFPQRRVLPVDLSSKFGDKNPTTVDGLRTAAKAYVKANQVGVPKVSTTISFVDLSKTTDYADVAGLEEVNLCDEVPFWFSKYDIRTTAKVSSVVWNVLSDSYNSITLGDLAASLSESIQTIATQTASQEASKAIITVLQGADGLTNNFYSDGVSTSPTAKKIGDRWFAKNGDKTSLYIWDGVAWREVISTDTADKIAADIDAKLVQLNADMSTADANLQAAKQDVADLQVKLKANDDTQAQLKNDLSANSTILEKAQADIVTNTQALSGLDAKLKDNDDAQAQLKNDLSENSTILKKAQADIVTNTENLTALDAKLKANDDAQTQLQDDLAANTKVQDQLKKDLSDNVKLVNANKESVDAALVTVNKTLTQAQTDAETAVKNADDAVTTAQSAVEASGLATTTANSANDAATAAKNLATSTANSFATVQSQAATASSDAADAISAANKAQSDATSALGNSNTAISNAKDALNKYNNLSIGGRNYFLNSSKFKITPQGQDNYDWNGIKISPDFFKNSSRLKPNNIRISFTIYAVNALLEDFNGNMCFRNSPWYAAPFSYPKGTTDKKSFELIYSITDSTYSATEMFIRFMAKDTSDYPFVIENAKLEIGTTFTDWSPAPEDVQVQISNINGELSQKVSQTDYDTLTNQVTDNTSQLKLTATAASLEVTSKKVDTLSQTVTDQGAKLDLTATSAQLKVTEDKVDALNNTVSDNSAQLKLTATSAALETQSNRVDTISGKVDTNTANITAANGEIELKANNSTVDALSDTVKQQGIDLKAAQGELKLKLTQSDLAKGLDGYATQTWAQNQITATANGIETKLSTVKAQYDDFTSAGANLLLDAGFESGTIDQAPQYWLGGATVVSNGDTSNGVDTSSKCLRIPGLPGRNNDIMYRYFVAVDQKDYKISVKTRWNSNPQSGTIIIYAFEYDATKTLIAPRGIIGQTGAHNWTVLSGTYTPLANARYVRWTVSYSGPTETTPIFVDDWWFGVDYATSTQFADLKLTVDGFSGTFAKQTDLESTNSKLKVASDGLGFVTAVTGTKGENVTQVIADVKKIQTTMTGANGYTTRLQTLEGFQSTATNDIKGIKSQQTLLANQYTSIIGDLGNMVRGGDFEDQTIGQGSPYWPTIGAVVSKNYDQNNTTNTSATALQIGGLETGNRDIVYSDFLKVSSTTYAAKMKTRWDTVSQNGSILLYIFEYDANKGHLRNRIIINDNAGGTSGHGWREFTGTYTPGSDVAYIKLDITYAGALETRSVWVDDIDFRDDLANNSQITQLQDNIDLRVKVDNKVTAALSLSADGGGTVTIRGASLYVTADSHFDNASIKSAYIDSIDATKITSGSISSDRLATTKLNADNITSGSISADRLATTKLNASNITSGSINAGLITTGVLSADMIVGGIFDASKMTVKNISADSITSGSIATALLATTKLNADNITSGSIAAERLAATKISATNITGGTFDASKMTVKNINAGSITSGSIATALLASTKINADNITSGSISSDRLATTQLNANNITSGSIAAERLATTKLNADNITSGSISAARIASTAINANNITSGSIAAERIATTELSATNITSGTFDASKMTVKNINAGSITSGSIATALLASTKINADNITSGSIAAERLAATKISATNIVGGTFDAGTMTVKHLTADMITSGTLDASNLTVKSLSASSIVGGTLDGLLMTVKNINASSINTGTLNAAGLNVIGLNADSIAAGTITGAHLAINLDSGQVVFQSGRIHSASGDIDINIDPVGTPSYMAVQDPYSRVLIQGGRMQFVALNMTTWQSDPYFEITDASGSLVTQGAALIGRQNLMMSIRKNMTDSFPGNSTGLEKFAGIDINSDSTTGSFVATKIGGANKGVEIVGGTAMSNLTGDSPSILIGATATKGGGVGGNRIRINGEYVYSPSTYKHTMSGSANVIVASDGALVRTSSATKYKSNIERFRNTDMGEALLNLPQAHWYNKQDMQRYVDDPQHYSMPELDYGMIAEDLAAAGLEDLVVRGDDGQLEDIRYDRMTPALLPLLAQMKQEIEELKSAAKSA